MSFQTRSCPSACAFLALFMVSMTSSFLGGQTVASSSPVTKSTFSGARTATATFLAAPSLALSHVPSGVVSTDLDGDGRPDLVVISAATGNVSVYMGKGKGKFGTPIDYVTGGHPSAIVAADINGDGIKDIVTANGTDGTVSVLLTIAGGKLAAAHVYTVGIDAGLLIAGDLNGDGKPDILVASKSAKAFATLVNDGQGTLQKASIQALGGTPAGLAVADFNGDNHVDVAVAEEDGTVDILLGAGNGSLTPSGRFRGSSSSLSSVVSADFNGDSKLDLAVIDPDGRLITVFLGQGDGTFSKSTSYKVGNRASSIMAADVNGDGIADLVSINSGSNTISVLIGSRDGSFRNAMDVTVGDGPVALAAADFYGDGFTGLAVINTAASNVNIVAGKGDGTFHAAPSYSGDLSPRSIASGDLNGDGLPDIVVTNFCGSDAMCGVAGSLSVYLAQKAGGYQLASTQSIGSGPVSVALADLNGDGILDAVALNRSDKSLSVLLGVGDGTFQAATASPLAGSPVAVVAIDLDKDKKIDLAVVSDCGSAKCSQRGSVDTYFGLGDGTFRFGSSTPVNFAPTSIAAGDLNGDGVLDLVVANACGKDASCNSAGTATVLLGATGGAFNPQPDITLSNGPSAIALRVSSVSSALDLVVSHETDNTVAVLSGNGDGTFKQPVLYTVGISPHSLVIADLNGDGKPDVAVANTKDSTVSVLYGQTDGTLVSGESYAVAAGPEALTAVVSTTGMPASLVTANGNSASTPPGSEITSLTNLGPNAVTGTTTVLTITPTSGTVNSAFTLQATISPAPPDGEFITFSSDVSQFSDCNNPAPIASGVASCTTSQITAGPRTLTANYPGDPNFSASFDNEPQTVSPLPATLNLAGPQGTLTVNQSATFTASLSLAAGASFTPTAPSGTISFTVNGVAVSDCPNVTLSGGATSATCTTSRLAASSDTIVATYGGTDPNYTVAGSPATLTQTVSPQPATLNLAGPQSTPTVNQPVTFTASLALAAGSSFTPTAPSGTISFTVNGVASTDCPSVTLAGGVTSATCTTRNLVAPSDMIVATYGGTDLNYTVTGSPGTLTQTVSPQPATLNLAGPQSTPTVNQSVTFIASLILPTGSSFTPTPPSGTISFTINGVAVSDCPNVTLSGGVISATCTTSKLVASSDTIIATYGGTDSNYTVSGSPATLTQPVNRLPATLNLAGPQSTPTVNQQVTFTASLSLAAGATFTPTAPSGTISFTVNGVAISDCPSVTLTNNATSATCITTKLVAPSDTIVAIYGGTDPNYAVSGSPATLTQAISPQPATLSLAGPQSTPTVNQQVTFTASLSLAAGSSFTPTAPSGTISFTVNGVAIGDCPSMTLTGGLISATCTTNKLVAPSDTIVATYGGTDPNYTVAVPATLTQTVSPQAATLSFAATTPSTVNASVTFVVTLNAGSLGPITPNGAISFSAMNVPSFNCVSKAVSGTNLSATCMTSVLVVPADTIVASYGGDPNFQVATNATVTQNVSAIPAKTTVTSDPPPAVVNQPINFTATVTGMPTGPVIPTGSVTFTQGANTLCSTATLTSAPSSTSATASCSAAFPNVNSTGYSVVATYVPSGPNFTAGNPGSVSGIVVNAASTSTTLATSVTTGLVVNQSVTFTATIVPNPAYPVYNGASVLAGTVAFVDQTTSMPLCSAASVVLNGSTGTASCPTVFLSQGTHTIAATFTSTTTNFGNSAASPALSQTISAENSLTSVVPSSATVMVNAPLTLVATVVKADPTFPGTSKPQGTVSFMDGSAVIANCGTVALSTTGTNPTASCTNIAFVSAGTHNITAVYTPATTPTTGFNPSTSVITSEVVTAAATALQINTTNASPSVDQPVTFTSTLTPQFAGPPFPVGKVTFTDGNTAATICSVMVNADGTVPACPAYSFSTSGNRSVSAVFTPSDNNFSQSAPATAMVNVAPVKTTLQIAVSNTSPSINQQVLLTATLGSQFTGSTPPQGKITFTDSSNQAMICTVTLDATGNFPNCPAYSFLSPGSRTVTAIFTPSDTNFITSMSLPVAVTVAPSTTTLQITTSTPASVVDQLVTFTATLIPQFAGSAAPQGNVTFTDSLTKAAICMVSLDATGNVPACPQYAFQTLGSRTISAVFTPSTANSNFLQSNTPTVTVSVSQSGTAVKILSISAASGASAPLAVNEQLLFSALVTAANSDTGLVVPSGTVVFSSSGTTICTATNLNTAGVATCTAPLGAVGAYAVTASYTGDSNFLNSPVSAPSTVPIVQAQTTLSLTSSLPISVATRSVTFTATLNVSAPAAISTVSGTVPLAGTISFTSGGNITVPASCTSTVSNTPGAAYLCTITYPAGTATSFPVTATFNPSGPNFASSANTVTQTVQDFSIQFVSGTTGAAQPFSGPLNVTQSYSSMKDPFNAVPTLSSVLIPISSFGENLSYACSLPVAALGLSCSVTPGNGLGPQSVVFTASATATLGTYVATITGSDTVTTALSRSTTLTVNVGGSVPTSLSPGVTGTVSVPFTVPAPQDTFTFACGQIVLASTQQATSLLKCAPVAATGSLSSGSATFVLSPGTQTSMNLPQSGASSRIFAATFFCVPLLAFAGCFGRRGSSSRSLFRFLAVLTLLAGVSQTIGCGGGFTLPAQNAASTTGTYLVQVTATDTSLPSRPVYYAVIPVVVQ